MTEKINILYFVDRMLKGGIQSLVIDWVKRFDKEKIQVDFLLLDDGNEYLLEKELENMGCHVYKLKGIWINKPTDFIKYAKALNSFFKEHHHYKVVHMHSSSKNYMVLKYAKKYKIPIRIAHSHCTAFQTKNPIKKAIGKMLKPLLIKYSTNFFACSKIAGEWLFGKKIVQSNRFKIIHNAVDYNKFKYNETTRKKVRKELKIKDNEILIGHVGRFTNQKNHTFLIDIFHEITKINSNVKLIMIGTGIEEDEIKEKVKKLNLQEKVIFAGFKDDVSTYYQAIDIFILPSLSEGLGVVLIEAQASGIPCFASKDVIPNEAKVTSLLSLIDLKESAQDWAKKISNINIQRIDTYEQLTKSNYLIEDTIKEIMKVYTS